MKWFFLPLFLLCQSAMAFNVFTLSGQFDNQKTTDVYVVGYGPEMVTLFLQAAVANAKKQNELHPERQQLFIWAYDQGAKEDLNVLTEQKFNIIESNGAKLSLSKLTPYLRKLSSISSFHFFGHSAAFYGLGLQEGTRIDIEESSLAFMKKLFIQGGYAIFHGCNTGFYSAPNMSAIWQVPVLGSLTSTDFQRLHSDGNWYHNNEGQFPNSHWASENALSFTDTKPCNGMNCFRMKPNNHSYTGHWGGYEVGLPFMKAFCNFDNDEGKCSEGILSAILSYPTVVSQLTSPSRESFQETLVDLLCPRLTNSKYHDNCKMILSGVNPQAQYYNGNQLKCSLKGCEFEVKKKITIRGTRKEFVGKDMGNQTLINEYNLYMKAFDAPGSF